VIQLLPQLKIFLAYQPVDFRKGIDGLLSLCRHQLEANPYDGSIFVFRNRRGTALKILTFDGVGPWLRYPSFLARTPSVVALTTGRLSASFASGSAARRPGL
jgi:transposase